MAITHWETSKKPLFVKTFWKDGQRHVILQKEENKIKTSKYFFPIITTYLKKFVKDKLNFPLLHF